MSAKPETVFRKRVRRDLARLDRAWPIWFEPIQQRAISGSPDFICCIGADCIALELKEEDGVVSRLQDKKLKKLAKAGGCGIIVEPGNWADILEHLWQLAENYHGGIDDRSLNLDAFATFKTSQGEKSQSVCISKTIKH